MFETPNRAHKKIVGVLGSYTALIYPSVGKFTYTELATCSNFGPGAKCKANLVCTVPTKFSKVDL